MKYNIALVKGDGIGPDIVSEAVKVLEKTGGKFSHDFVFTETLAGGAAIDEFGIPLPEDTVNTCLSSDAVLLGAVGGSEQLWQERFAGFVSVAYLSERGYEHAVHYVEWRGAAFEQPSRFVGGRQTFDHQGVQIVTVRRRGRGG